MTTTKRIVVVGLGGTGTWLLQALCRYVSHLPDKWTVALIDGDDYTLANSSRQAFKELGNKASSQMASVSREWPDLDCTAIPHYLGDPAKSQTGRSAIAAEHAIQDGDFVFCCVDNHSSRKHLSDHCRQMRNAVLISGGNDATSGQVQVYVRSNGADKIRPITELHPEIENPADKPPHALSCDEAAAAGAPQTLFANLFAATLMACEFHKILQGQKPCEEVCFDIGLSKAVPQR